MNCKRTTIRILKLTALLLPAVLLILLFPVNDFGDSVRIRNFYLEPQDSLDVIILGSSENYAGYSPVLAYEEYGFTSYPFVFSANDFTFFEEQLEEVLRVQSPKIVVVDVGEMLTIRNGSDTVLRQMAAGMPLSRLKTKMIAEHGDREHLLSYYLPFIVNHGKSDFKMVRTYIRNNMEVRGRGYSLLKGVVTFTGSGENWDGAYVTPINTSGDLSMAELPPEVIAQCRSVLEACAKHPEVQFLFINSPHRLTTAEKYLWYQEMNALGAMIRESGYPFYNMDSMTDEIGIVPEMDFYNNHHMNLCGQYKATRFLCDILTGDYGLVPRSQSAENRMNWDNCVEYSHLYYQLFEKEFQSRKPDEFGRWLLEDAFLIDELEEMKRPGDIS